MNDFGCCGYYATMIAEEYFTGDRDLFKLTEKFLDRDYIKNKLLKYEMINKNIISIPE